MHAHAVPRSDEVGCVETRRAQPDEVREDRVQEGNGTAFSIGACYVDDREACVRRADAPQQRLDAAQSQVHAPGGAAWVRVALCIT